MRKTRLTAAQKKILSAHGIAPAGWSLIREDEQFLTVYHNDTGELRTLGKAPARKRGSYERKSEKSPQGCGHDTASGGG